jgi:HK97 family phage prohead protease
MSGPIGNAFEIRMAAGDCRVDLAEDRKIRGYAIVFNALSVNLGGFREIIKPEAVDRTLTQAVDVRALWNHDTGEVLGRTRAGTLSLTKDRRGLRIEVNPPSWARHRLESIERGDVTGMSFRFKAIDDEWREGEDGFPVREVNDMTMDEVSIVTFPAYQQTDVSVALRSLDAFRKDTAKNSIAWLEKVHRTRMAR